MPARVGRKTSQHCGGEVGGSHEDQSGQGGHRPSTICDRDLRIKRLSRNDSIGSVVLAASSSAKASLFTRYGPSIGPRLALASSCERIRDAIPSLPTESFRLRPGSRGTMPTERMSDAPTMSIIPPGFASQTHQGNRCCRQGIGAGFSGSHSAVSQPPSLSASTPVGDGQSRTRNSFQACARCRAVE